MKASYDLAQAEAFHQVVLDSIHENEAHSVMSYLTGLKMMHVKQSFTISRRRRVDQ